LRHASCSSVSSVVTPPEAARGRTNARAFNNCCRGNPTVLRTLAFVEPVAGAAAPPFDARMRHLGLGAGLDDRVRLGGGAALGPEIGD
jgi:hypothetical protein